MKGQQIVVGIGELLWDVFPEYAKPGGAPANFSYNVNALGNKGICVSALGEDPDGEKMREFLTEVCLDDSFIQTQCAYPTGKVSVKISNGEPVYIIHENVAWDYIRWDDSLYTLAKNIDAVCFSTLSQRNEVTRKTIYRFLEGVSENCLKVLDLNLRPPFISNDVIAKSLMYADVVKLNEYEFQQIKTYLQTDDLYACLAQDYSVKLICTTLGEKGSKFSTSEDEISHPGYKVDISKGDLVGVGDAFIACVTHHLIKNTPLDMILEKANRYASYLAARKGAMNSVPKEILREIV